jgi:activator of HSP90 ATPase
LTRRNAVNKAVLALLGLACAAMTVRLTFALAVSSSAGDPVQGVTIHQEVDLKASPQRVYEVLLDAKQFSAFSGSAADIDGRVGGAFSVFDGHIVGRNVELIPGHRIVQAWRVVTWSEGVYSIARFELKAQGSGTHVVLDHTGFPEELRDHLAEGWQSHYWALLQKYFK